MSDKPHVKRIKIASLAIMKTTGLPTWYFISRIIQAQAK